MPASGTSKALKLQLLSLLKIPLVEGFDALSSDAIVVIVSGCVCGLLIRLLWLLSAVAADKLQASPEYPCRCSPMHSTKTQTHVQIQMQIQIQIQIQIPLLPCTVSWYCANIGLWIKNKQTGEEYIQQHKKTLLEHSGVHSIVRDKMHNSAIVRREEERSGFRDESELGCKTCSYGEKHLCNLLLWKILRENIGDEIQGKHTCVTFCCENIEHNDTKRRKKERK